MRKITTPIITSLLVLILLVLTCCKTSNHFTIQTASSDVLYIGTENALILKGIHLKNTNVTIENGTLRLDSISDDTLRRYYIKVNNTNPTFIKVQDGKSSTILKYRNKIIPNPEVVLQSDSGNIKGGEVSLSKIKTVKSIQLNLYSFDYNCAFKILNYKLTIIKNNSTNESFHNGSIINYLQSANTGDIYIFHNVLVEFIGNKEQRKLNGLTVIVK